MLTEFINILHTRMTKREARKKRRRIHLGQGKVYFTKLEYFTTFCFTPPLEISVNRIERSAQKGERGRAGRARQTLNYNFSTEEKQSHIQTFFTVHVMLKPIVTFQDI